jgi:hypothetical protein
MSSKSVNLSEERNIDNWGSGWVPCVVIYILSALNGVCSCLLSEYISDMVIHILPVLNDFNGRVYNKVYVSVCQNGSMFLSVVVVYGVDVCLARVK